VPANRANDECAKELVSEMSTQYGAEWNETTRDDGPAEQAMTPVGHHAPREMQDDEGMIQAAPQPFGSGGWAGGWPGGWPGGGWPVTPFPPTGPGFPGPGFPGGFPGAPMPPWMPGGWPPFGPPFGSPGMMRPCLFRINWITLNTGQRLIVYVTRVTRRHLHGYQWTWTGWSPVTLDLDSVVAVAC